MKLYYKRDMLIILAVLALAALLWFFTPQSGGAVINVSFDGKTVKTVPLSADGEFTVDEVPGMVFAVKNGQAYIVRSDCPDRLCEQMGPVSRAGQAVVCLPNRVVLTVESPAADPGAPDMIAG